MRRGLVIRTMVVGLFLALFLSSVPALEEPVLAQSSIVVGLPLVMQGPWARLGVETLTGARLAAEAVNQAGGVLSRTLSLVHSDTAGLPGPAAEVVERLIGQDKVSLLIGPLTEPECRAVFPLAEQARLVTITPAASGLTRGLNYCFSLAGGEAPPVEPAVEAAQRRLGLKRAAVFLVEDDGPGLALGRAFLKVLRQRGVETTRVLPFRPEETSFSGRLALALADKPEALVLTGPPATLAELIFRAREQGYKGGFLGAPELGSAEVLEFLGTKADGTIFASFFSPLAREAAEFTAQYKLLTNRLPGPAAARAYDAVRLMAFGLKQVGRLDDPDGLASAIRSLVSFPGPAGLAGFEPDSGEARLLARVTLIKGGQPVLLDDQSGSGQPSQ